MSEILNKIDSLLDEAKKPKEYPSIDELGEDFYSLPDNIRKVIEKAHKAQTQMDKAEKQFDKLLIKRYGKEQADEVITYGNAWSNFMA